MPNPEMSELQAYVDQLIEATHSGSVTWKAANPTTYVWDTAGTPKGRLVLQRSERTHVQEDTKGHIRPVKVPFYQFQVLEITPRGSELRISIDSSEQQFMNSNLDNLYELIKTGVSRKGLAFLKDIIPHP